MPSRIITAISNSERVTLSFDISPDALRSSGVSDGNPDLAVQAFDPHSDVFYRAPEPLRSDELYDEVAIHFPAKLRTELALTVFPSTLGTAVLMQLVGHEPAPFSPLTALAAMLRRSGTVNTAILECSNSGLLFVRRAGEDITAHFSACSVTEFVELEEKVRADVFPDFDAGEIILSGPDSTGEHANHLRGNYLTTLRHVRMEDLTELCDFNKEALKLLSEAPHRYTLCVAAAVAYQSILRDLARGANYASS